MLKAGAVFFVMRTFYWTGYDYTVINESNHWSLTERPSNVKGALLLIKNKEDS